MIIDAHHHLWHYSPQQYPWIGDSMHAIRRDFTPADLEAELDATDVDGVVSVQARQTLEETDWLLGLADRHSFIRGVVGWVPLAEPGVDSTLERLSANAHLKAVRHVLQGEGTGYALDDRFNRGLSRLKKYGLAYDILIVEHQLPEAIEMVDRHPKLHFVLDHVAKPRIRDGVLQPWADNIRELARRDNVTCKLSGMVTEADPSAWTTEQLRPYTEVVLEAFGPPRLMFGSDWPVCLLGTSYPGWRQTVGTLIDALSDHEQSEILGGTAVRAYSL